MDQENCYATAKSTESAAARQEARPAESDAEQTGSGGQPTEHGRPAGSVDQEIGNKILSSFEHRESADTGGLSAVLAVIFGKGIRLSDADCPA